MMDHDPARSCPTTWSKHNSHCEAIQGKGDFGQNPPASRSSTDQRVGNLMRHLLSPLVLAIPHLD